MPLPALRGKAARSGLILALAAVLLAGCVHGDYAHRGSMKDPYAADLRQGMARRAAILSASEPFKKVVAQRKARIAKRTAARSVAQRPQQDARPQAVAARPAVLSPALATPVAAPRVATPSPTPRDEPVTVSTHQPTMAQIDAIIASPASTPVAPRLTLPSPLPRAQESGTGQRLIEEGRSHLQSGRVLKARERFYAAMVGPARTRLSEVLPELARSYDPNVLRTLPKADAPPNAAMARALYQRSLMLGVIGIDGELDRLGNEAAPVAR